MFKPNDWNKVRIEAIGDSIRTWLNGEPRAEIRDGVTPRGFIGLQVHGIGKDKSKEGSQVRWRNLRIKEVPNTLSDAEKAEGWKLLWNGRNAQGWRGAKLRSFPKAGWEIEDGVLTVLESGGGESTAGGDIVTRKRYDNFELKLEFKITPGANSGIKILEYERGSDQFRDLVTQSKYRKIPGFGEWADGHILLQDHGNTVSFRSIKLRELPDAE